MREAQCALSDQVDALAPLLGPAIGPIAGAWIAQTCVVSAWRPADSRSVDYRWIFYSSTILGGLIQLSGVFFLRETCACRHPIAH